MAGKTISRRRTTNATIVKFTTVLISNDKGYPTIIMNPLRSCEMDTCVKRNRIHAMKNRLQINATRERNKSQRMK